MKKSKFSFIILVDNSNNLKFTLDSIYNQKYNQKLIEIILFDKTGDESVQNIINDYKKVNFIYKSGNEKSDSEDYNEGLKLASGDYVTFINSNMYYNNLEMLKNINKINDNNIIVLKSFYHDIENNENIRYKMQPKRGNYVDLEENPYKIPLILESYFIKRKTCLKYSFNKDLFLDYKVNFIIDILQKFKWYYFFGKASIISLEPFEDNTSKNSLQYHKYWYLDSLEKYWLPLVNKYKKVPYFIQEIIMYQIYARYNCNIYDRNKDVLTKEEYSKFENLVIKLLSKVDDKILLQTKNFDMPLRHQFKIQRWLKFYLLENKINLLNAKKNIYVKHTEFDDMIFLKYSQGRKVLTNLSIGKFEDETIDVYAINYKDGKLYFDCSTSLRDFLYDEEIKICVKYNNKEITIKKNDFFPLLRAFGKTLCRKYNFSFCIDALPNKKNKLEVIAYIGSNETRLKFKYEKVYARLSKSKKSFWHYKDFIMYNKRDYILIRKANIFRLMYSELMFDLSKLKNVKNKKRVCKLLFLRMIYYITKPYYKNKHIWLTWDKLYKAGDNGEYLYHYGLKHNKNIYYIIKKDSLDYGRLKKENPKHIIIFNSIKAKLFALHAEVILKTHVNVVSYCGFNGIAKHFICGLFNPEIIEVQHGLTIQKIAQYQNRLFDNIKYYCCTSKYEVDNIMHPFYNFDKSQIELTGLARYDGLKSNDKKILLITPTWRRNVVNSNVAHIKKQHNENFKSSEYYHIYNSLINNKKLIDVAKETGYRIIYLLHPAMSAQLEDYDKNDYVEMIPATGDMSYEKILTESSLMVTDYSGVQFDFAYQRKVLVYYHPDLLPPHYAAGGLDYEKMGFGPVCKNEEDLVSELCDYMKNNCKIKEQYKKRVDDFFAYSDFNNCKRIFTAVDNYLEKKEK